MNETNKAFKLPMEDDEDLQFLRMAALKSLNNKKDVVQPPAQKNATTTSNIGKPNIVNEIVPSMRNAAQAPNSRPFDGFYPGPSDRRPPLGHPVDTFVGGRLEQMDLNDPYVPQQINAGLPANPVYVPAAEYVPFVPISSVLPVPVQLSPRSAAFVSQNNDILMRRKVGRSSGDSRSPSPLPYRESPGRWSVSPPPKIISHLKHSPNRNYRRSTSRSPINQRVRSPRRSPRRSPIPVRRTLSRSPQRQARRYSPNALPKSRSPNRNTYPNTGRVRSRSPHLNNRRPSPSIRPKNWRGHSPKNWRGNSPTHALHGNRSNGGHPHNRSQSPRSELPATNYQNNARRRTRSPAAAKLDIRKRSNSKSPARKFQRNGPAGKKRRSPLQSSRKMFRNDGVNDNRNNRRNMRRSASPFHHRRSGSKPRNLAANPEPEDSKNGNNLSNNLKTEEPAADSNIKDVSNNEEKPEKNVAEKTDQEVEDELLASTDDEKDSSADDGIDLFASEESESENEGRFKSSSSKTERAATATVSFSKLGSLTAPVVRDLNEVRSDKIMSNRRENNGGRDRERDRNSDSRRGGYANRRNDRMGERDRNRDRNGREGSSRGSNWKNIKNDARRRDGMETDKGDKSKRVSPKFSNRNIDNETKKANLELDKSLPRELENREKQPSAERKNVVVLRRPTSTIVEKDVNIPNEKVKDTKSTEESSSNRRKSSSPSENTASGSANNKKPIHLRLGAMTKTWKSNKKAWKSEKVFSIVV